jgi:hypothetical protein
LVFLGPALDVSSIGNVCNAKIAGRVGYGSVFLIGAAAAAAGF